MKSRVLAEKLQELPQRRLVILTGARQTGKTTLARWRYPGLRYVNFDAMEYRDMLRAVSSFHWKRDVGEAILDEVQKEPSVFDKVKFAYDEGQIDFTVLLGSSQILLMQKVRETLAGRAAIVELWPLMLCELMADAPERIERPLLSLVLERGPDAALAAVPGVLAGPEAETLKEAEAHLLHWGGMPELLRLAELQRAEWLRSYERTYLERDLADLARIDDLEPFRKFQRLAALRAGNLLNYSELARDAGVGVDTSRRYLEYLRLSYQAILLQPWHVNLTSTLVKTPKLYWADMGLLRQTAGLGSAAMTGALYENHVVAEIWKWCKTSAEAVELYFYRTRSGLEVDLILETPERLVAMEVKWRDRVVPSDTTGMRKLAGALGERWGGGIVAYGGNQIQSLGNGIWAVPSRRLLYK
jgi:uncharacterized protein